MTLKVVYHDVNIKNHTGTIREGIYESWKEDGSYTAFFDNISRDSISLIIPTSRVYRIEFIKNDEKHG